MQILVGMIVMVTWAVLGYYGIFTETPVLKTIILGFFGFIALITTGYQLSKFNKGATPKFTIQILSICLHLAVIISVIS